MNLPNKLTILRIVLIPFFMFFLLNPSLPYSEIIALLIYSVASVTDSIDGYLARKHNLITDFGKFMDPLADKLLVISSLICFVEMGVINSWVTMIIVSRELAITGFRTLAVSKGITLAANIWGKIKTIFQMITIILILVVNTGMIENVEVLINILMSITVLLTILSGIVYIGKNRKVLE
jgi:CDP-diacylglycerol--glycerol-3-phosphate 3-phosphatidyltransferase